MEGETTNGNVQNCTAKSPPWILCSFSTAFHRHVPVTCPWGRDVSQELWTVKTDLQRRRKKRKMQTNQLAMPRFSNPLPPPTKYILPWISRWPLCLIKTDSGHTARANCQYLRSPLNWAKLLISYPTLCTARAVVLLSCRLPVLLGKGGGLATGETRAEFISSTASPTSVEGHQRWTWPESAETWKQQGQRGEWLREGQERRVERTGDPWQWDEMRWGRSQDSDSLAVTMPSLGWELWVGFLRCWMLQARARASPWRTMQPALILGG